MSESDTPITQFVIEQIYLHHPNGDDFAENGRYVWPERFCKLKDHAEQMERKLNEAKARIEEQDLRIVNLGSVALECQKAAKKLDSEVARLRDTLKTIRDKMCVWLVRDAMEGDKVVCAVGSIQFEIAKALSGEEV